MLILFRKSTVFTVYVAGEPDAVKVARPVRGGGVGKAVQYSTLLAGPLPYKLLSGMS